MIATTAPGVPSLPTAPLVLVGEGAGDVADADVLVDSVGVPLLRAPVDVATDAEGFKDGDVRSALLNVGMEGGADDADAVSVPWVLLAPEATVVSPGIVTTVPLGPGEGSGRKNEDVPVLTINVVR